MRYFVWALAALLLFCAGAAAQQLNKPPFQQALPQDQTALLRQDVANLTKMVQQIQAAVQQVQADASETNRKVPNRQYFQNQLDYIQYLNCGVIDLRNRLLKTVIQANCDKTLHAYPEE
jgi:hypothetical protein